MTLVELIMQDVSRALVMSGITLLGIDLYSI